MNSSTEPEPEPEAGYGYNAEILNCENCKGVTKRCRHCGTLLNWVNGNPIEYAAGVRHSCPALKLGKGSHPQN